MQEKKYYREVVADIKESTGKTLLGINDVRQYLHISYSKALHYMDGEKKITVFQLAAKLI